MPKARIALGQLVVSDDKPANLAEMLRRTSEAAEAGAQLVAFPEEAMADVPSGRPRSAVAEPLDGPFVTALQEAAAASRIGIVTGLLEAREGDDGRVYNTAVAIGPDGGVLGSYRKVHLFDAFGSRESDRNAPGDGSPLVFSLAGVTYGVAICYDLRFPEIFRALVDRGADVLLLPTAWRHGRLKELHLDVLARARAIENTAYFAAIDQTGGVRSGNSMLIDPMGVTVAGLGEEPGLLVADLDTERVTAVRATVPSLQHRRPDVYDAWRPALAEVR